MKHLFLCGLLGLIISFSISVLNAQNYIPGTYPMQTNCPYAQTRTQGQGRTTLADLEQKVAKFEAQCEQAEEDLVDLENLDTRFYDDEKLPLKSEVQSLLLQYQDPRFLDVCTVKNGSVEPNTIINSAAMALNINSNDICRSDCGGNSDGCERKSVADAHAICGHDSAYNISEGRGRRRSSGTIDSFKRKCMSWLDALDDARQKLEKKCDAFDRAVEDLEKEQERAERALERNERYGSSGEEEIPCYACQMQSPEPRSPSTGQVVAAAATDIIGGYLTYRGYKYVSDQNAALGWDTSPIALGSYYPYATRNLYAAYAGGGQGAGSWGCSSTINGVNPNSNLWNNPYFSNGQNPYFSNMNPYMMNGMGNMNPYLSGLMPGAGYGYANPFSGGFAMSGNMNLYGQNPYMGGMNGGYGNPFMGGMNGGYGNPFMGGMYGGYGNPFMGGMNGGYGNPFMGGMNGGLGSQYQNQLLQMQMQQQQAYMQAQVRALQNQQVVSQQMYGLQLEYQQLMQRYQRLMSYSSSGGISGSIYLGINGNSSYLTNSGSSFATPGSSITDPPR